MENDSYLIQYSISKWKWFISYKKSISNGKWFISHTIINFKVQMIHISYNNQFKSENDSYLIKKQFQGENN